MNLPNSKQILLGNVHIVVDGFNYAHKAKKGTLFILTHAHSDHYTGIRPDWSVKDRGRIYCSEVTARLITHILGIPPSSLHPLPLNTQIDLPGGVQVTLIDANHCPGAVQLLFRQPHDGGGKKVIHTGDFRFNAETMLQCPHLAAFRGADELYLDTTYAKSKHAFPPQEESVEYVASKIHELLLLLAPPPQQEQQYGEQEQDDGGDELIDAGSLESQQHHHHKDKQTRWRQLFLISTYVIGKERILQAVAERCGVKIYTSDRKAGVMACIEGLPEGIFTSDPQETPVHVVPWGVLGETWPYFRPNWTTPAEYLEKHQGGAGSFVGFVPTGWVSGMAKDPFSVVAKDQNQIHLVPYSEHSSFPELMEFVKYIRPVRVVPTVVSTSGSSDEADRAVDKILKNFTQVIDQDAAKAKFIAKMGVGVAPPPPSSSALVALSSAAPGKLMVQSAGGAAVMAEEVEMVNDDDTIIDCSQIDDDDGDEIEILEVVDKEVLGSESGLHQDKQQRKKEKGVGNDDVELLVTLTDSRITSLQARQLLQACNSDVSKAADAYFTGRWRQIITATAASGLSSQKVQKSTSPGGGSSSSSSKKRKKTEALAPLPGQKSILPFFNRGGSGSTADGTADGGDLPLKSAPADDDKMYSTHSPSKKLKFTTTTAAAHVDAPTPTTPLSTTTTNNKNSPSPASPPRNAVTLPLHQYHPVLHAPWSAHQPCPYLHLSRAFECMDATNKRLTITNIIINTFRSILALSPLQDAVAAAYLCVGKIGPDYEQGMELNVGGSLVAAAVSEATGVTRSHLREMYNELGDLGDVAAACKRTQQMLVRPAPLTVAGVMATLRGISTERGQGSSKRRQSAVLTLLRSCREAETKYVVRTLVQALRVGANWRSIVPAIGKAMCIHSYQTEINNGLLSGIGSAASAVADQQTTTTTTTDASSSPKQKQSKSFPSIPGVSLPLPPKSEIDAAGEAASAAFHVCPDLDLLITAMQEGPMSTLEQRCRLTPGVPLQPMLGKISEGVADAVKQVMKKSGGNNNNNNNISSAFLGEYKYDGVRAQIHLVDGDKITIFSRNNENRTAAFPDVAAQVINAAAGGARSCILDAEIVAVERGNINADDDEIEIRLRPFQELARRPRGAVELEAVTVDVCVFVFDIVERNGESLLWLPLRERRAVLLEALPGMSRGYVQLAQGRELSFEAVEKNSKNDEKLDKLDGKSDYEDDDAAADDDPHSHSHSLLIDQVQTLLLEAVAAGTEGLMLKSLSAAYQPSKRSDSWIKLKKDYCESLQDSIDVVVIGAWHGSGRKAGWYSPFLLAVFDPETDEYQSICRCMSGFSDEFYRETTARLQNSVIPVKRPYYVTQEHPDVWFDACEVWEIRGADLTLSPVHKAAVGKVPGSTRGVGLRFPRFLRRREDKTIEEATTAEMIATMYDAQERKYFE